MRANRPISRNMKFLFVAGFCCFLAACSLPAYEQPPPIVRTNAPTAAEVRAHGVGAMDVNRFISRFRLAEFRPIVPDWSEAQSGNLLASWNTSRRPGKNPTIVIQHGGMGGSGATDYGHARWFLERGFNVLVLDSFWSRGFIANWRRIDQPASTHQRAFSALGPNTRARDAFAAARWLRNQPEVDPDRIFLLGGSQGGGSVLRAFTDEKSITEHHRGLFRAGVSIYPTCWSWQWTPGNHGHNTTPLNRPALGPFYAPVLMITVELEPPGSMTDINSCDPNLVRWVHRHIHLANMTHAFDAEIPPENPVNRCWYSENPFWCQASGGRDPVTRNCFGAPKPDFCADREATEQARNEILGFLRGFDAPRLQ